MKLSIEEQKTFLLDRLKLEPLRKTEGNKEDIKAFVQATKGGQISNYLIKNAWNDDCDRNTKVFLVRDWKFRFIGATIPLTMVQSFRLNRCDFPAHRCDL